MNNIALIHPRYENIVLDTTSIPLGLAWLSSYLKLKKFQVDCYDLSIDNNLETITKNKYKIIGIQVHSYETLSNVIELVNYFKNTTTSKVIIGGPVATMYWQYIIKTSLVDFIVLNEGEITLYKLANFIINGVGIINDINGVVYKNRNGVVIYNPFKDFIEDLDSLPMPDREAFKWNKYKQWSVITSRGCPFQCKFCTSPSFWNGTYRQRTAKSVFEEICYLQEKFDINNLFFLDDTFTINRKNIDLLLDLIISSNYNFIWACLTRADLLDESLLHKMKRAGCKTISIGVESANQDTLNYLQKNIKLEVFYNIIPLIKKASIRVRCSFIFGFPNENINHLNNNIDFILSTTPDEVQIYPLFPYFGTKLSYDDNYSIVSEMKKKDALNPIIETANLSSIEIKKSVLKCIEELRKIGYKWLSSQESSQNENKNTNNKVVMTEFSPIQNLKNGAQQGV